jgi:hypothetical protein
VQQQQPDNLSFYDPCTGAQASCFMGRFGLRSVLICASPIKEQIGAGRESKLQWTARFMKLTSYIMAQAKFLPLCSCFT